MEASKYLILLNTILIIDSSQNFINQHCQSRNGSLLCYNFHLKPREVEEIQNQDFSLSQASNIIFRSGDIGVVNINFFTKFPNAERISFTNVNISLESSNKITNFWITERLPLKVLIIASCGIASQLESNSLKWLNNLEEILFYNVTLREVRKLDEHLFMNIANLKILNITNGNMWFRNNVFGNFMSLKSLTLRNQAIYDPGELFLKQYYKLVTLDLSFNYLLSIPNIPGSVESLNLDGNKIIYISRNDFENLGGLKTLSLNKNRLKFIHHHTFHNLLNLMVLNLADNEFSRSFRRI